MTANRSSVYDMNWLAHVSLSPHSSPAHQLGNLVADLVKGRVWDGAASEIAQGMALHQRIDLFTDVHPVVRQSQARLGASGRLRGVVVDILYDHFLTRHWDTFFELPLDVFVDAFYREARLLVRDCPPDVERFVIRLIMSDYLRAYAEPSGVLESLSRVDTRLSERLRKVELTSSYFPAFEKNYRGLEQDFLTFFPSLIQDLGRSDEVG